ncbi:MAG: hypothetical protein JST90_19580 [Bacteroidetes bacterium]|nr:hypothetical protein [Bacteroidota bacterium]
MVLKIVCALTLWCTGMTASAVTGDSITIYYYTGGLYRDTTLSMDHLPAGIHALRYDSISDVRIRGKGVQALDSVLWPILEATRSLYLQTPALTSLPDIRTGKVLDFFYSEYSLSHLRYPSPQVYEAHSIERRISYYDAPEPLVGLARYIIEFDSAAQDLIQDMEYYSGEVSFVWAGAGRGDFTIRMDSTGAPSSILVSRCTPHIIYAAHSMWDIHLLAIPPTYVYDLMRQRQDIWCYHLEHDLALDSTVSGHPLIEDLLRAHPDGCIEVRSW